MKNTHHEQCESSCSLVLKGLLNLLLSLRVTVKPQIQLFLSLALITHRFGLMNPDGAPEVPSRESRTAPVTTAGRNGRAKLLLSKEILKQIESSHGRIPGIKKVPLPAIGIIAIVALINVIVWVVVGVLLVRHFAAHFLPVLRHRSAEC